MAISASGKTNIVAETAIAGGALVRPWFGARMQSVTADIADSIGLGLARGALVTDVVQPYAAVDSAVARFSRQGYSPDSLVPFATREFKSDTHRVRAFFTWIALNIAYDKSLLDQYTFTSALIGNFRPGGRSQHADTVLAHRKAVCEGYCNLMNRFCAQAGITSVLVPGITRIQPWLTPLAAAGLMIVMASATVFHLSRGETSNAISAAG